MRVTKVNANLRMAGNGSASVIKVIPKDSLVELYSCSTTWCKVKATGSIGWMARSTLTR